LKNIDQRSTEITMFILELFDKENVDRDIEVCAELILISRLIQQRLMIRFGKKIEKNSFIEKAKIEIIDEMKKDDAYDSIKYLVQNYRDFKSKNLN
jgi:hypothetical protein